jgi:hypothetical protein
MKTKIIITGETQRSFAIQQLREVPLDTVHVVTIQEKKNKRSIDQNALHWKRLDIIRLHIANSTGQIFSAEDLHEFFKCKFMTVHLVEIGGESVKVKRTTTSMNTKEFSEFMDSIDRYCIDRLNLYLPIWGMID